MKHLQNEASTEERELYESLLKYPALEEAYEKTNSSCFSQIKQQLKVNQTDFERVVIRGNRIDAEKASRVVEAYQTAIKFLEELENSKFK